MNNEVMFKLGYGLYVLSTKDGDRDNGCIINTVMQVSENPVRIAVCVNKMNYTRDIICKTGIFNVSMLTEETSFDMFKHFGFQSGREVDKFADFEGAKRADNGINYITKTTNGYLAAKVSDIVDLGSHTMFIAQVTDGEVFNDIPSVTYDYYQKNIKPRAVKTSKEEGKKTYRCKICGYEYEGDTLPVDFVCPLCKHGAVDFELV